jgi:chromosomal replication initiation ATPase DnaA
LPTLKDLSDRPGLSRIERAVDEVLLSEKKLSRQVKLHLCHRLSGMKLKEIGRYFDMGESGVTHASRRVGIKAARDEKLRETIKTIESKIVLSNV